MLLTRTLIAALTLACAGCSAGRVVEPGVAGSAPPPFAAETPTPAIVERGRSLAVAKCQGCHATGRTGDSAFAAALPLREIANLYPPTELQEAFGEGVMTGHPAMPQFTFEPREINDLIAYLDTLRTR